MTKLRIFLLGKPKIKGEFNLEYAFTIDGTDFFAFLNFHEIPVERAYALAAFFEQFQMRMTEKDLKLYVQEIKSEIDKVNFKKTRVIEILKMIEDRMNQVLDIETVYNLASIVFVTKHENILKYDPAYADVKKRKFLKADIPDFFLGLPLSELQPFSQMPITHFRKILSENLQMQENHLKDIEAVLSSDETAISRLSFLQSKLKEIAELKLKI